MLAAKVKDIERFADHPGEVLAVKDSTTVAQAAKKMTDNNVGCLAVFDAHRNFTGVITERDILAKVMTKNIHPGDVLVQNIMTANPISCTMHATVEDVEHLMASNKIRHLPILHDDRPIGMLSSRDIIAYQLHSNKAMKAAAEQLAMLSTKLKNLPLKDVIALAIDEVPMTFAAQRAVLALPKKDSADLVIYRRDCPLSRKDILDPERIGSLLDNNHVISDNVCERCRCLGAKKTEIIIPLRIEDPLRKRSPDRRAPAGFLCMCSFSTPNGNEEELRVYKASLLQEILTLSLTNARLYETYRQVCSEGHIEPITGVTTSRALDSIFRAECARAARYHWPFTVAVIRLENFSHLTSHAGPDFADDAMTDIAKTVKDHVRATDVVARYDIDKLILILPETDLDEAQILLRRIRERLTKTTLPAIKSPPAILYGTALWDGSHAGAPTALIQRAEQDLKKQQSPLVPTM
jgi:diguanylate cyclase (GGDEF)-like protein